MRHLYKTCAGLGISTEGLAELYCGGLRIELMEEWLLDGDR